MSVTSNPISQPEFDPQTDSYHVHHDTKSSWDATSTLVVALSSLTDEDPTEMPPLHYAVDPEVLNNHVQGRDRGATLSFEFNEYDITVQDDGQIEFSTSGL